MTLDANFWSGKRVLVTGHTGFKGSWLSFWLSQMGSDVYGISLAPTDSQTLFERLNLKQALKVNAYVNICDKNNLKSLVQEIMPDVVFHLAAQPLVREGYRDPLSTWETNLMGSLYLLESLKTIRTKCAIVMITTDKVYNNIEKDYLYSENDRLGGFDPYSASKAGAEIAISSWRSSYVGIHSHQNLYLRIATARAGNVIGGGDWAHDRIVPDIVRALLEGRPVTIRNPKSTRPWQHVLDPLSGYLLLAQNLYGAETHFDPVVTAFNFGPYIDANKTVLELTQECLGHWEGAYSVEHDILNLHEACLLNLCIEKASLLLGWKPVWEFAKSVEKTIRWYKSTSEGHDPLDCTISDISEYLEDLDNIN